MTSAPTYTHADKMQVLSGVLLCILLAAIDQTVVLPAIPQMKASLPGTEGLSWVVSAYLLTSTATTPIYGKFSDRFGRRPVLIPAIVMFVLASIFCAEAHSVGMLIAGRALQGFGGGGLVSVTQAAVADVIPPRERGKYQGWFAGTWAVASTAGPIAGGFVAQALSWRWIFWINIPFGVLALFLCWRGLAIIPRGGSRSRIDYIGALLMMLSVSAILFGLSSLGTGTPWFSLRIDGAFFLGVVLLAALALQQKIEREPLFPAKLMAMAGYRSVLLVCSLVSASMFGGIFMLPLFLQDIHHATPAASGAEIVPFMAVNCVAAFAAGLICRRTGRTRGLFISGMLITAAGFLLLTILPREVPIWAIAACAGVAGGGIGLVLPTGLVAAQNEAPSKDVGIATSILLLLRAMGGAFGATVTGALVETQHAPPTIGGFRLAFLACALATAVGAVAAFRMREVRLRNTLEVPAEAVVAE